MKKKIMIMSADTVAIGISLGIGIPMNVNTTKHQSSELVVPSNPTDGFCPNNKYHIQNTTWWN